MCIISPLLLLAPEVAQHASARNCNSTEWQFLSLPSTLTYSASHSTNTYTHTYTQTTCICKRFTPFQTYTPYNFSSLTLSNHPLSLLIHLSLLRTPSINIPLSFTFSSPHPSLLPREHTHPPPLPLFPVFSADVPPFTPDYRRFDLLKPRAIEPYTSFILKQNRAFAASWCRCRMRPLITC